MSNRHANLVVRCLLNLTVAVLLFAGPTMRLASASDLENAIAAYEAGRNTEALRLLEPLARAGDASAQFYLGLMHLDGLGVPSDPEAAMQWFRKAAEQGDADARYNLGLAYA